MKFLTLLFFGSLLAFACHPIKKLDQSYKLRPEIQALSQRLNKVSVSSSSAFGAGLNLKDSLAIQLQNKATPDELIGLTRHPSAVVRSIALFALLNHPERDSLNLHRLAPEHFQDTATVELDISAEYPRQEKVKVGELYLMGIGNYHGDIFSIESNLKLTPTQKAWLDSVYLCSNTAFNIYKGALSWNWRPKEGMYDCLRTLLASGVDNYVAVFLAKYQREADIPIITSHLPSKDLYWRSDRWEAFQYFKHPQMFEFLESELETAWTNTSYLRAVAEYKDQRSAVLLDSVYAHIKRYDPKKQWTVVAKFGNALSDDYAPVYSNLLMRVLSEHSENTNLKIPDALWETHADSLYKLSSTWKNGGKGSKERAAKMLPKLLEYLEQKEDTILFKEVVSRIKPLPDYYYTSRQGDEGATMTAYTFIYRSKNPFFIDPLFDFLKKEPLAKYRFFIAKILQTYGDPAINQRIANFFKENPTLAPKLADAEEGGKFYSDFIYRAKQK